jgi:hypothetical protein
VPLSLPTTPAASNVLLMLQGADPFKTAEGDDGDKADKDGDGKPEKPVTGGPNNDNSGNPEVAGNAAQNTVTGKRGPQTHPTEDGAQKQAATVAPEGTEDAAKQAAGGNADRDYQIDRNSSGVNGA